MSETIELNDRKMLSVATRHIIFARSGGSLAVYVKVEGEFIDEILEMENVIVKGMYDYYVKLDQYIAGETGKCLDNEMEIGYGRLGGYIHVTKERPSGYYDEVYTLPVSVRSNT